MIDIIGMIGVVLLIGDYFLLVRGVVLSTSWQYYLINIAASGCILFTLCFNFNLASFITQIIFILIGVWGFVKNVFYSR